MHQHQRPIRTAERGGQRVEYIEATLVDIELANRIAHDVLGRSLDELPPQTRRLLALIDGHVGAECQRQAARRTDYRFARRVLREAIAWGDTQLKVHLARLVELEYLVAHRTRTGGHEYELVYELAGDDGARFPGLADIEGLKKTYDAARSGLSDAWSGSGRPLVGLQSAGGRADALAAKPASTGLVAVDADDEAQTHCSGLNGNGRSYPHAVLPLAAVAAGV